MTKAAETPEHERTDEQERLIDIRAEGMYIKFHMFAHALTLCVLFCAYVYVYSNSNTFRLFIKPKKKKKKKSLISIYFFDGLNADGNSVRAVDCRYNFHFYTI